MYFRTEDVTFNMAVGDLWQQIESGYTTLHTTASAVSSETRQRTDEEDIFSVDAVMISFSKVRGLPPPPSIPHTVLSRHQRNFAKCDTTPPNSFNCISR